MHKNATTRLSVSGLKSTVYILWFYGNDLFHSIMDIVLYCIWSSFYMWFSHSIIMHTKDKQSNAAWLPALNKRNFRLKSVACSLIKTICCTYFGYLLTSAGDVVQKHFDVSCVLPQGPVWFSEADVSATMENIIWYTQRFITFRHLISVSLVFLFGKLPYDSLPLSSKGILSIHLNVPAIAVCNSQLCNTVILSESGFLKFCVGSQFHPWGKPSGCLSMVVR